MFPEVLCILTNGSGFPACAVGPAPPHDDSSGVIPVARQTVRTRQDVEGRVIFYMGKVTSESWQVAGTV